MLGLGALAARPVAVRGQDLIAVVKRTPAAALDSSLARTPIETWLASLRGTAPSAITWEVNDCGEGGDGRAAPTCVEAGVPLGGDTVAYLRLGVRGIDGKVVPPEVFDLSVKEGPRYSFVPNLAEWIARVRRRQR